MPRVRRELSKAALEAAALRLALRPQPQAPKPQSDPVEWLEDNFYVARALQQRAAALREAEAMEAAYGGDDEDDEDQDPDDADAADTNEGRIILAPHQKCVLRLALTRNRRGRMPYSVVLWSQVKKSGKSAIAAGVGRWFAETQTLMGYVPCCGNDAKQAKERSFWDIRKSITLAPGYDKVRKVLPGRWLIQEKQLTCLLNDTRVMPLAVDSAGEAGSAPDISLWTEAWAYTSREALLFFAEMAPAPTVPDSMRWVESYAGFDGESLLLHGLYMQRETSRQLTAHDLAVAGSFGGRSGRPGESYEELLHAFEETGGAPDALVPVWTNDATGMLIYWDEGEVARRMPWQKGERGRRYYASEEISQPSTAQFERLHLNLWGGSEHGYLPMSAWDACRDEAMPPLIRYVDGRAIVDQVPLVLGVDAGVSHDCFGIVAVSRRGYDGHPDDPAVRACRLWTPPEGGEINFDEPEAFIRWCLVGGCALGHPPAPPAVGGMTGPWIEAEREGCAACRNGDTVPGFVVYQVAYDAYQLKNMMQRLKREQLPGGWFYEFPQQGARLIADKQLYDLVVQRRLRHNGDVDLRTHVRNANAKVDKSEDSKLRIKKKQTDLKVDLVVATSMAVDRCLFLTL